MSIVADCESVSPSSMRDPDLDLCEVRVVCEEDAIPGPSPRPNPPPRTAAAVVASPRLGYDDYLLRAISDKLGERWSELGFALGITKKNLDELNVKKTEEQMIVEILLTWLAQSHASSRCGDLNYALGKISRPDLVHLTLKYAVARGLNFKNPDMNVIHEYFKTLASSVGSKWEEMALHLGLTTEDVHNAYGGRRRGACESDAASRNAFRVLKMWQDKPDSTHHQLLRVMMEDLGRLDVVRYVCRYLEREDQQRRIIADGA